MLIYVVLAWSLRKASNVLSESYWALCQQTLESLKFALLPSPLHFAFQLWPPSPLLPLGWMTWWRWTSPINLGLRDAVWGQLPTGGPAHWDHPRGLPDGGASCGNQQERGRCGQPYSLGGAPGWLATQCFRIPLRWTSRSFFLNWPRPCNSWPLRGATLRSWWTLRRPLSTPTGSPMAARSFLWSRVISGTCSETSPWATFGTFCPPLATLRPSLRPLSTGSLRAMDWRSRSCSTKRSFRRSTSRRGAPRRSTSWMQALRSQISSANAASPHGSSSSRRASAWSAARLAPACTRWRTWAWLRRFYFREASIASFSSCTLSTFAANLTRLEDSLPLSQPEPVRREGSTWIFHPTHPWSHVGVRWVRGCVWWLVGFDDTTNQFTKCMAGRLTDHWWHRSHTWSGSRTGTILDFSKTRMVLLTLGLCLSINIMPFSIVTGAHTHIYIYNIYPVHSG